MALHQQKFREIVFQILFSSQFDEESKEDTAYLLMHELKVAKRFVLEALQKVSMILEKLSEIDEKIRNFSKEYQFERISLAEKCALRMGLFEILYESNIPRNVAIAEAIRITRKFGSREGAQFVNAILDGMG